MTAQSAIQSNSSSLLRRALLGNCAFSTLSGAFFLLAASPIASFLGLDVPLVISVTGINLLVFAAIVYKVATGSPINRTWAGIIIALDVVWVIGSMILIFANIFANIIPLTTAGKWAIAIVADIVSLFAIAQYIGLRRTAQS